MSFGDDLNDFSMLDLFRSEVETHSATINEGLLVLESNPSAKDKVEELMRAAHSIKGGARIVELDPVVKLAHNMEDCFVAIQKNEIEIEPDHIDILLKGVDMIIRISEAAGENIEDWMSTHHQAVDKLVDQIASIHSGTFTKESVPDKPAAEHHVEKPHLEQPKPAPKPPEPDSEKYHGPPAEIPPVIEKKETTPPTDLQSEEDVGPEERIPSKKTGDNDRAIRVTAGKIERLMGLAGEVVVNTRWLPSFFESLLKIKKNQNDLLTILEKSQKKIDGNRSADFSREFVFHLREKIKENSQYLLDRLNELDMFTNSSVSLSDRLYHEVVGVRMRPFSDGVRGFPRMVRDVSRELGKKVKLEIIGESTEVDRDILDKLEAPINHLLRNAVDHGFEFPHERVAALKPENGLLRLEAIHRSGILMITVSDDGRGIDPEELRQKILKKGMATPEMVKKLTESELMEFLFLPGFSTLDNVTEISGRGVGLDVVHNMVHSVGGVVRATSQVGKGTNFILELPLTLSVIPTFLVEIAQEPYAFPLARIDHCLKVSGKEIEIVEDREYFRLDDKNISLVDVHEVLESREEQRQGDDLFVVIVSDRMHSYGLVVDRFLGEYDLVVRPLDARLGKVPDISATSIMLDGSPVLIFDVDDLVRSIDGLLSGKRRLHKLSHITEAHQEKAGKHILVVDDSITVREMERRILENKGYRVDVAVDGMEGWNLIRTGDYDMVVSDIDMPRMNGFELVTLIKQHEKLKSLPVMIVSYKNKEEDRLKGLEAGANYYLTKSSFQDNSFINAVVDLIGEA